MLFGAIVMLLVLVALRVPVAAALAVPTGAYFLLQGYPLSIFAQRAFAGIDQFTLIAIPLFVLIGNILERAGALDDLLSVLKSKLANKRAGVPLVNVADSAIFSGVSGSAAADVAALGPLTIPLMSKAGYSSSYAAALTAVTSIVGPVIPPSIVFIFYGTLAGLSISDLFLAGLLPGVLIVGLFAGLVLIRDPLSDQPVLQRGDEAPKLGWKEWIGAGSVVAIGGTIATSIAFGIATPTEAAAIGTIGGLCLLIFARKRTAFSGYVIAANRTARLSGEIFILIATSNVLAWLFAYEGVSEAISIYLGTFADSEFMFLMTVVGVLVFIGLFLDTFPALTISLPVLVPLADNFGVQPLQLAVVVVLSLMLGAVTPPVGICLYTASKIAGVSMRSAFLHSIPFLAAVLLVVILVAIYPGFVTYLPGHF